MKIFGFPAFGILLLVITLMSSVRMRAQVIHLPHGFAHNDYLHERPLYDALENGFTHIEADVYLRHGQLLVAHQFPRFNQRGTIETLYLQPLYNRCKARVGCEQTAMDTVVLMIDIKSNSARTYAALKKILHNYREVLSTCDNGKVILRNITVVLTGHRPLQLLREERNRMVFVDKDLRKIYMNDQAPHMFTMASCKYSSLLSWKGRGIMPVAEKSRLQTLVMKAHSLGQKVRLWASPEKEKVWLQLRDCGVDLINTDKLVALKHFFTEDTPEQ